jgi:uncharacterized protein (DUF1499 family)
VDKSKEGRPRRWLTKFLLLLLISFLGLYGLSMSATTPSNLGINNGQLAECPESPNCVSTQTDRDSHRMAAIPFEGSHQQAMTRIKSTITDSFPRARLVSENDNYLHYEFTSLVFRFVDDVEFFVDDEAGVIHFRSASRVGHSDLGATRRRMNKISGKLTI